MSEDLPRTIVKRLVKNKMMEIAAVRFRGEKTSRELPVHRDALMAFSESTKIFIHYLSATANDICRESKRQTIMAEDVLRAVEEVEFVEFIEPLRFALAGYRKANESKKAEKKVTARKRKLEKGEGEDNGEVDRGDQEDVSNTEED